MHTNRIEDMNIYISKLNIIIICNSSIFIYWFIYYCINIALYYTIDLNTIAIYDSGRIFLTQYILVTQYNVYLL